MVGYIEFTCNPVKSEINLRERCLPLLAVRSVFNSRMVVREDTRKIYPERRFIGCNTIAGRLLVVVFCVPAEQHIHIISLRKANRREQAKFKTPPSESVPDIDWAAVDAAPLAHTPDADSPELTTAEFAELRPLTDALPALGIGKQRITIMLDETAIRAYKAMAGGRGYQTLINETLRRALQG